MSPQAIVITVVISVLAACSGSTHEATDAGPVSDAPHNGGALQLNDLSVLFPLTAPADAIDASYLAASTSGDHGALLPKPLYSAVGAIAGSQSSAVGGTGSARYEDLHVVAIRLDPCFASLAPDPHGAGCVNQVRLVFQQLTNIDGQVVAFDSGLHAFYQVSRDDLLDLANSIASLRAASSTGERLGALAPHPIMMAQGLDGPMAKGVRALVLRYVGATNLTRITELSSGNAGLQWTFSGADITDALAPTFTPMVIPTLPTGTTSQSFFRGFAADVEGEFMPATASADNLVPLANAQSAAQLSADARAAAFASLVRVEHPAHDSPDTIDCASCHLASPVEKFIARPVLALDDAQAATAFVPDGVYVLPSEMTPTAEGTGFNIHAFSYFGLNAAINQRTVNETAANVAYLDRAQLTTP